MPSPSESHDADAVVAVQLRALGEYISAHREDITRHWVGAVDRSEQVEASSTLTFRQVLDHFPRLCSDLAAILQDPTAGAVTDDSSIHGRHRWEHGYRLDEVIRELVVIRRDFLARCFDGFESEGGTLNPAARKAAKRIIHGFFDDVTVAAAVQYVQQHDQQIRGSGTNDHTSVDSRIGFLGLVSHELRTPLTPVVFDLAVLESDPRLPDELKPVVRRLRQNTALEVALIDELLDATRIAQDSLELDLDEPVDVHDLLETEIASCESTYADKRLILQIDLRATATKARADEARLRRAFSALLRNAANVSRVGGQVSIVSHDPGPNQIEISIEDAGEAMDEELASRVFVPFDLGRVSEFGLGRLGLGRYVAKKVIEAHGGALQVRRKPDRGAIYILTLPAQRAAEVRA